MLACVLAVVAAKPAPDFVYTAPAIAHPAIAPFPAPLAYSPLTYAAPASYKPIVYNAPYALNYGYNYRAPYAAYSHYIAA